MKTILVLVLLLGLVSFCFAGVIYDAGTATMNDEEFKGFSIGAPTAFIIWGGDKEVGRLEWKTGKLIFTGDAEESAKVFFNQFLKPMVDAYIEENCKEKLDADK